MSAPILWILLPIGLAAVLSAAVRFKRGIFLLGILTVFILAGLAWGIPVDDPISLGLPGAPAFVISETLTLFGRRLIIGQAFKPLLLFILIITGIWFLGAYSAKSNPIIIPIGLGSSTLLIASLAIETDIYAVLIILLIVLLCVTMLSPPGHPARSGILRFLSIQTIGLCFLLIANWFFTAFNLDPENIDTLISASIAFGLGLAMTVAVIPFHTWVPMLSEIANPHTTAYVLFFLPTTVIINSLDYLNPFHQAGAFLTLLTWIRTAGLVMILVGGLWAMFENHMGRIMGYAAMVQIGTCLVAISFPPTIENASQPVELFFLQLIPMFLGLIVWGQALCAMQVTLSQRHTSAEKSPAGIDLQFNHVQGLASKLPIAAFAVILCSLSLAGLPLLAGFPAKTSLWSTLLPQSGASALAFTAGHLGLLIAGTRTLAVLLMNSSDSDWRIGENRLQAGLLIIGVILIIFLGLFPDLFAIPMINAARSYTTLIP